MKSLTFLENRGSFLSKLQQTKCSKQQQPKDKVTETNGNGSEQSEPTEEVKGQRVLSVLGRTSDPQVPKIRAIRLKQHDSKLLRR